MEQYFNPERINKAFDNKKTNAKRRGIDCKLTREHYVCLVEYLKQNPKCVYTGKHFDFKNKESEMYPTIERIDSSVPYILGNVVWVGRLVNHIKGSFENKQQKTATVDVNKLEIVKAAAEMLLDNTKAVEEANKLKEYVLNNLSENNATESTGETEMVAKNDTEMLIESVEQIEKLESKTKHNDVDFAVKYANIANIFCEKEYSFELSFSEYKRLMSKKCCSLTGVLFDEDNQRSLYVLNKDAPITNKNVLVVTKNIRQSLDKFVQDAKLSSEQTKNVFEQIVKFMK